MNNIKSKLRNFKLAGMASSLEERLLYANNNKLDYQEFLDMLCDDEENNRRDNSYRKRYAKAKISSHKSLKDFDFAFQPSIDEKKVNDLSLCGYIEERKKCDICRQSWNRENPYCNSTCINSSSKRLQGTVYQCIRDAISTTLIKS